MPFQVDARNRPLVDAYIADKKLDAYTTAFDREFVKLNL